MKAGDFIKWPDIMALCRVDKMDDHVFDFTVVYYHEIDPMPGEVLSVDYERRGATSSDDRTKDFDDAQRVISGYIKWDGCANVDIFQDEGGSVHLCGLDDAMNLSRIMFRLYCTAARFMPGFDKDCAGFKDAGVAQM